MIALCNHFSSYFFTNFRLFLRFLAIQPILRRGFTESLTDNGINRPDFRQAPCGFEIFSFALHEQMNDVAKGKDDDWLHDGEQDEVDNPLSE